VAVATARALGRAFTTDARLGEVARPWVPTNDELAYSVAAYLRGEVLDRWEPQASALERFAAAATGIVVTHGTVMSLYVGAVTRADPVAFWQALTMPDAWSVAKDGVLTRLAADGG
jgi:broad specificity phosphatase PhoE